MNLRPYQETLVNEVKEHWAQGKKNVLAVSPTGSGKTVSMAHLIHEHVGASCSIAHRQELVSQISLALAREGVLHTIIGPSKVAKLCARIHMEELGRSYFDPRSPNAVAGVNTLVKRLDGMENWANKVTLWVTDEAHHISEGNQWHTAVSRFPNAKGLGVTATPVRTDGKGLGSHADGVFDSMVIGPSMGDLLKWGFLTPYKIYAPPSDLDLNAVRVSASTGDFSRDALVTATRKSHVMGDVVSHYIKLAYGKRGVTFATDVQSARELAEAFNLAGIPAVALDGTTPDEERIRAIRKLKSGELWQIVNVDLFGEGFDLPAIEVVSMARATMSYGLYVQIFGRALRLMEGKEFAIIIDHVGNVLRHGLPDAPRKWSLDRRDAKATKAKDPNAIPIRACPECTMVYERFYSECPFCGHKPVPANRSSPEFVDGDLLELDEATLAALRGEIAQVDKSAEEFRAECAAKYMPLIGQRAHVKRHVLRQEAQEGLRDAIAWWAGHQRAEGRPDSESYRRFFHKFGVDVLTAQTLGAEDAKELETKIREEMR